MITDDERREVARRLRDVQSHVIPGTKTEDNPITGRIIGVACWYDLPDFQGLLGRLADLIDPSCDRDAPQKEAEEMFGKMRHSMKEEADAYDAMLKSKSVEIHPVDRDALLALADEMQRELDECASDHEIAGNLENKIRRIREACGVER